MIDELFRVYLPGDDPFNSDGYPLAWDARIKHVVRSQAGYRCVRCGHPYRNGEHGNGEWSPCDEQCHHGGPIRQHDGRVEAQWRILTCHHLTGEKADNRWWNIAALCQRDHLTIQGRVLMHRRYDRPHSEWFRPYAAGFYAAEILGEELSRDETMARLDELLTLELRQHPLFNEKEIA